MCIRDRGKTAVCHPGFEGELKGANVIYENVAVDENIITSRGMGTAFDLSLIHISAAGMNPNETKELMETIRFVRDKFDMTVLLIEHDMKLVSGICEELTVLNFGQVLAQGKTSDVLNNPEVIKAYLGE